MKTTTIAAIFSALVLLTGCSYHNNHDPSKNNSALIDALTSFSIAKPENIINCQRAQVISWLAEFAAAPVKQNKVAVLEQNIKWMG